MSKRRVLIMTGALAATWVIAAFVPLISPYARYPYHVVRCGGRPILASTFASDYSYVVPGHDEYHLDPFVNHFFCTTEEAEAARFHPR